MTLAAEGPAAKSPAKAPEGATWKSLFDGKSLGQWKVVDEFDFEKHGKVHVADGRMVLEMGSPATGVKWTGPLAKVDYEITLEAMRVEGEDFFCGLTFPVGEKALTLVVGGWGGTITGLSSIDGEPAVENETSGTTTFERGRWYRIRLRVTQPRIEAWIDEEQIVDLKTASHKFSLYWEMEPMQPLGICTWRTTGALRDLRVRALTAAQ